MKEQTQMRSHISCMWTPSPISHPNSPGETPPSWKRWGLSLEDYERTMDIYRVTVTSKWWKNPNIPHKICSEDDLRGWAQNPNQISVFFFRCFFLRAAHISFSKARFRSGFDTLNQQSTHAQNFPRSPKLFFGRNCFWIVPLKWSCSIIFHWTKGQLSRE